MRTLAISPSLESTDHWIGCVALDMEPESADCLYRRIHDPDDDLSALALTVVLNEMCLDAFGIDSTAAARLAQTYMGGWFPFRAWAISKGVRMETMRPEDILTAVYAYVTENCAKEEELDKINRAIFRTSNPWARKN